MLDGPAAAHKLIREPVQQGRVGGRAAVQTEIARRVHESGAKNVLPDPVHHHARGERMARAGDPFRELEASLLFRLIHGQTQRTEDSHRIRRHHLALLHGVAAIEPVRGLGLGKSSEPRGLAAGQLRHLGLCLANLILQLARPFGFGGGEIFQKRLRVGRAHGFTIFGRGDLRPLPWFQRRFDPIICRDAILKFAVAIPAPDYALNFFRCWKIKLHPTPSRRVGDPALAVPGPAVVEMRQFVDRITRQRAGGARPGSSGGQRHIRAPAIVDFQLVEARLCTRGGKDGEPHGRRLHRREDLFIAALVDRRTKSLA